jgi:DNA-binding response OmpR family regulator
MEFRLLHLLMSRPSHIYVAKDIIHSVWGWYGSGNPVMIKNGCIGYARRSKQTQRILYYCKPGRVDIH